MPAGSASNEVGLFELNKAFSARPLAVNQELRLDPAKVNMHGGAAAIGHPIGASATRILTTLLYALQRLKKTKASSHFALEAEMQWSWPLKEYLGEPINE